MITQMFFSDKDAYLNLLKEDWQAASEAFPDFLSEIAQSTKAVNEQYLQGVSEEISRQIKKYPKLSLGRKRWQRKTLKLVNEILLQEEVLGVHHYMSQPELASFSEELKQFLQKTRQFAPELCFADIGQAIRNYVVYVMFKRLCGSASGFNLAAFGYSMLYPFTDNYIDDETLSKQDKEEYNRLIRDKLEGREVQPLTRHQKQTCQLLTFAQERYQREQDDSISRLLLMMLEAQEFSLRQQNREQPLSAGECLDISIYKGGVSVLIDRFLVDRELTKADLRFYLGFGFFLQLADDLQDIKEDSSLGHSNLFTLDFDAKMQEKTVNKLLWYIHNITVAYPAKDNHLKKFLQDNCYQLIFSSVFKSREFFSEAYLSKLEQYLPVTLSYYDRIYADRPECLDIEKQLNYMNILDELIQ